MTTPAKDPRIPPVVIFDQEGTTEFYMVTPTGFVTLDGEDECANFKSYIDAPERCHPNNEPKGPVVTRIDFEVCEYCNGTGHGEREWVQSWEVDEQGNPYPELHAVDPKCADCDGLGWHYDFGANVSLAQVVARVRGERAA